MLTPAFADRPTVIDYGGGRVFVGVHDAAYLRGLRAWKRKLAEAHPDGGGSAGQFRKVKAAEERWRADELAWYEAHGLLPPIFRSGSTSSDADFRAGCSPAHVRSILRDRAPHSVDDLVTALQISASGCARESVRQAIKVLRRKGLVIALVSFGYHEPSYYLLISEPAKERA